MTLLLRQYLLVCQGSDNERVTLMKLTPEDKELLAIIDYNLKNVCQKKF